MSYCDYWSLTSEKNKIYHAEEWGLPLHNDEKHFEFLSLEVLQCGLNWNTIINKREIFNLCFDNFDFEKISAYTEKDIERIMNTVGMIRSKKKIDAIVNNAQCFKKIREEFGSFDKYIWKFSDGKTFLYNKHAEGYIPASNGLSDAVSKDLKQRGFKFLGTITIYSYLQSAGIINDHSKNCPRYKFINENFQTVKKRRFLEKKINFFGQ